MDTPTAARQADLETVLVWEGELDNERIRDLLGVKAVWASRLLGALAKSLGRRAKRETPYAPLRLVPRSLEALGRRSPDEYLRVLAGAGTETAKLLVEDARLDLSTASPPVFATMHQAAARGLGVELVYRSMSRPAGSVRLVFPHALVRASRRWHVRAWCAERGGFRDFTIGRIQEARLGTEAAPFRRGDDREWNNQLELELAAHPGLTAPQRAMIAAEYFGGDAQMSLTVRQCLAAYIIQDLRLATDATRQRPPEYQLHIKNVAALPQLFSD